MNCTVYLKFKRGGLNSFEATFNLSVKQRNFKRLLIEKLFEVLFSFLSNIFIFSRTFYVRFFLPLSNKVSKHFQIFQNLVRQYYLRDYHREQIVGRSNLFFFISVRTYVPVHILIIIWLWNKTCTGNFSTNHCTGVQYLTMLRNANWMITALPGQTHY